MSGRALISALAVLAGLTACSTTVTLGQGEPRRYPDGAARVRCGPVDCDHGKICCNASCGVCAAVGGCPPVPLTCTDAATPCGPDLVSLTGSAMCSSFVWNGVDCAEAIGCSCTGDCSLPQPTYADCMDLHAMCWEHGCSASTTCPHGYYCERASCEASAGGTCARIPADCSTVPLRTSCGCDGAAYRSPCEAARAEQTVAPGPPTCGACNPPVVTITSGCSTSLGWEWDGVCFERSGCACSGQCDRLEPTQAACTARYASACSALFPCGTTSCTRSAAWCHHVGPMEHTCEAPPMACPAPTCECLVAAGLTTMANCADDGAGAVSVSTP